MGLFKIFKRHLQKRRRRKVNAARQQLKQSQRSTQKRQPAAADDSVENHQSSGSSRNRSRSSLSARSQRSVSASAVSSANQQQVSSSQVRTVKSGSAVSSSERSANSLSSSRSASVRNTISEESLSQSHFRSQSSQAPRSITVNKSSETRRENNAQAYSRGLAKSRSTFGQKLNALFANFRSVDDQFFDRLEDTLIESDVGFNMAIKISDALRKEVKLRNVKGRRAVQDVIVKKMIDLYDADGRNEDNRIHYAKQGPTVFLFVGVNGAGKTTTIGKMAHMYHEQGRKVLLAAADTFRAGAIEQLNDWAQIDHVDIVKKKEHSDPSSVVYDAVHKAVKENYDILFIDTAGRLQNKVNLMNQLAKMKKVITRTIPQAPQEVMLVLDATTGQNALSQAKLFKQVTNVTGIILTKLDGTAKGGIILAIRSELHLPVKYVGLGEQVNDLRPFEASDFIDGLFAGLFK